MSQYSILTHFTELRKSFSFPGGFEALVDLHKTRQSYFSTNIKTPHSPVSSGFLLDHNCLTWATEGWIIEITQLAGNGAIDLQDVNNPTLHSDLQDLTSQPNAHLTPESFQKNYKHFVGQIFPQSTSLGILYHEYFAQLEMYFTGFPFISYLSFLQIVPSKFRAPFSLKILSELDSFVDSAPNSAPDPHLLLLIERFAEKVTTIATT